MPKYSESLENHFYTRHFAIVNVVGFLPKCKRLKVALIQMPEASSDSECDCKRVSGHSVAWGSTLSLGLRPMGRDHRSSTCSFIKGKSERAAAQGTARTLLRSRLTTWEKKANCVFSPSTKFSLMNQ